ncbi:thiol-disulfide isomerase/thioredoxin [Tamilnaduibacter salinus]|uniref:Thiol-disulfide isomerase/thioredoxin n=1 Tax=Tamilnaduibacter salinus TaxID=1484056 RepID=A0A2U1CT67_9GAMM|nr:TlpA disulfide reductase family protein [Tamilnaduibacter salinus]PVY69614.1 thiol-disulfide isomerase/thioredoxin [Tamilnaduibacter salinus]
MKYLVIAVLTVVTLSGCQRVSMETADGTSAQWSDYRGDWVFVNYWAEWCEPCRDEIPELNDLDDDSNVTVLGVNYDGLTGGDLQAAIVDMGIRYTVVTPDPGPALGWKSPVGMPATFVVSPDGTLVETRFGAQTEEALRAIMSR